MKTKLNLIVLSLSSLLPTAHASDLSVSLNQCQRKALLAVQIAANPEYDTYVTLAKMQMIGDTGAVDETRFLVDVDIGSSDANHLIRYQASVPSVRGKCIVDKLGKAKFIKKLF